jgi:3-dehydroquinate synthase II
MKKAGMGKLLLVRADIPDTYEDRKRMVSSALESGFVDILVREGDEELTRLGRYDAFLVRGQDILLDGERVGQMVEISSSDDLDRASSLKGKVENIVVKASDWKVIPLENLIADFQHSSTKLLAVATSPQEARLFSETLEVGVDGIVIECKPGELKNFLPEIIEAETVDLQPAKVTLIKPLTMGDRVCVDTCSLMRIGEGMLIGSQSSCLFLIASESLESEYVAARPFRVNAGAVHAYILTPGGKTRYLSEIGSGDEVIAVDPEGRSRSVVVGRSKVERRPLLLIEAEVKGRIYSTIVQNAETIRLSTSEGAVSISDLQVGQEVLVRLEEGGRHFGTAIQETIREK